MHFRPWIPGIRCLNSTLDHGDKSDWFGIDPCWIMNLSPQEEPQPNKTLRSRKHHHLNHPVLVQIWKPPQVFFLFTQKKTKNENNRNAWQSNVTPGVSVAKKVPMLPASQSRTFWSALTWWAWGDKNEGWVEKRLSVKSPLQIYAFFYIFLGFERVWLCKRRFFYVFLFVLQVTSFDVIHDLTRPPSFFQMNWDWVDWYQMLVVAWEFCCESLCFWDFFRVVLIFKIC